MKYTNGHTDSKHFPSSRQRRRERKFHENFDLSSVKEENQPLSENDATERDSTIDDDEVQDKMYR